MLYVTTRIPDDAFTAHRVLTEDRGPEGGLFLPMRSPLFSEEQIRQLPEKSFGQNIADVMNLLFNTELDGWSVEFAIGRHPVRMVNLGAKVTVAELWHNPQWQFDRLARNLTKLVMESEEDLPASDWMMVGCRIAMLFGIYGELVRTGQIQSGGLLDVVVPSGDFSAPMAAWYARQWGLPIGTIVICCNENNGLWNLLHQGELRTDGVAVRTGLPVCDQAVPAGLERLIHSVLGPEEVRRYVEICRTGRTYRPAEHQISQLGEGVFVSVVSQHRTEAMIGGIYRGFGYVSEPYTALAYSGLADYRARAGESRHALILSEESPRFHVDMVSGCLGIPAKILKDRIDRA